MPIIETHFLGSTFPKAKPKQSLLTVIRLAILRYVLLPLYAQWWVKQTTPNAFGFILVLYLTQLTNWAIYVLHSSRIVPLTMRSRQMEPCFRQRQMEMPPIRMQIRSPRNMPPSSVPCLFRAP